MDEEEWRENPNYPGFKISDLGNVISHKGKRRVIQKDPSGNSIVTIKVLGRKAATVRRLATVVLDTFSEDGPSFVVGAVEHLNGDKEDNRLINLAWRTERLILPMEDWPDGKDCTRCQEYKLLDEFYAIISGRGRFGRFSMCKVCCAADNKQRYWSDIEASHAKGKAAREARPNYQAEWTARNPDYWRTWGQENKDRLRKCLAQWRKENPEAHKAQLSRRRALLKGLDEHFSGQEWQDLCELYQHTCLCCGITQEELENQDKTMTADHIVPLVVGGFNTIDNIQPLCQSCNSKKHTKTIDFRPQSKEESQWLTI